MNIEKMSNDQLRFVLEMNNSTLDSIKIGLQNWRNTMLNCHVETGEMSLLEFNEKFDEAQIHSQLRINDIEKENSEIYAKLQGGN